MSKKFDNFGNYEEVDSPEVNETTESVEEVTDNEGNTLIQVTDNAGNVYAVKKPEQPEKKFLGVGGVPGAILEWVVLIAVAVGIALLLRAYVFSMVHVQGPSMEHTLQDRDWLFVNRFMYTPQRGHIVIFEPSHDPDRVYIKRVIAVAGDELYISSDGGVYIDGVLLTEPYIHAATNPGSFMREGGFTRDNPLLIEEGYIFVMGDNRAQSQDSRDARIGPVPVDEVMGRAMFRVFGALR